MTAARATPRVRREPDAVVAVEANLDFEEGELERLPIGWNALHPSDAFGYRAITTGDRGHRGDRALLVEGLDGPRYGELPGGVVQVVDAGRFRGRRIRVRGSALVERESPTTSIGYLWLEVRAGTRVHPRIHRRVTAASWRTYELEADVPSDATEVRYGFAFVGEGRAWLDDVHVESIAAAGRRKTTPRPTRGARHRAVDG